MKIRFLGHSGFLLSIGETNLVIDPFLSAIADQGAPDPSTIKAEYILLTHGHTDHVLDAAQIAKNNDATILSNYEITNWFSAKSLKTIALNQGGKCKLDFGTVHYVSAIHSSSMPDGSYGGNPGGFVIEADGRRIYFSGDSALTMDMKLIPLLIGDIDWSILPIGDKFTMDHLGAIHAANFVNCKHVIGCHFDTFPPLKIDKEEVKAKFDEANIGLILPEMGKTYDLK